MFGQITENLVELAGFLARLDHVDIKFGKHRRMFAQGVGNGGAPLQIVDHFSENFPQFFLIYFR